MINYSNFDDGFLEYQVLGGGAELRSNPKEEFFADANGLSNADNECPGNYSNASGDPYASFMNLPSFSKADGEYSEARGRRSRKREGVGKKIISYTPLGWIKKGVEARTSDEAIKTRQQRKQQRQDARLERKSIKTQSKADTRTTKATAKQTGAEAQRVAAQSLSQDSQSDIALAKALAPQPEQKKGLSTGQIVGIAIGSLALIGIVGYFVIKSKKANNK